MNTEIFVNSTLGIKKVVPRECTHPEEFHMEIEERLKQRHVNEVNNDDKTEEFEFHARPVPKAILKGTVVSFCLSIFCYFFFYFSHMFLC